MSQYWGLDFYAVLGPNDRQCRATYETHKMGMEHESKSGFRTQRRTSRDWGPSGGGRKHLPVVPHRIRRFCAEFACTDAGSPGLLSWMQKLTIILPRSSSGFQRLETLRPPTSPREDDHPGFPPRKSGTMGDTLCTPHPEANE